MKCPYCDKEMIHGDIQLYEMGSVILHMPATMKFKPDDREKKNLVADPIKKIEGWYCDKCNKIVSIASAQPTIWGR